MHRRSARLAANRDGEDFDDLNTHGSTYVPSEQDVQSQPTGPFRFLDLPAEIRNNIYTLAFSTQAIRNLGYLQIPPLIFTSHQIRNEARSIFCAEPTLRIEVGCNHIDQHCVRKWNDSSSRREAVEQRQLSGVIKIQPRTSSFLEAAGEAALFRNIELEVFVSFALSYSREARKHAITAVLHMRVSEGSLHMFVDKDWGCFPSRDPKKPYLYDRLVQDVEESIEKASSIARDIAAQDVFKGFKIADLKRIAMAFRLE